MRRFYITLALILAACGPQPAPEFFGAQRVDLTRAGRDYSVYFTQKRVEVIRLGWASNGEHAAIRQHMIDIIPQATGCRLVKSTLQGDSGEMRGSITCPNK